MAFTCVCANVQHGQVSTEEDDQSIFSAREKSTSIWKILKKNSFNRIETSSIRNKFTKKASIHSNHAIFMQKSGKNRNVPHRIQKYPMRSIKLRALNIAVAVEWRCRCAIASEMYRVSAFLTLVLSVRVYLLLWMVCCLVDCVASKPPFNRIVECWMLLPLVTQ